MSKWSTIKNIRRASIKARARVNIRWQRVRAAQAIADAAEPSPARRIVERHVVIRDEARTREAVFYDTDRPCDIRRKLKALKSIW